MHYGEKYVFNHIEESKNSYKINWIIHHGWMNDGLSKQKPIGNSEPVRHKRLFLRCIFERRYSVVNESSEVCTILYSILWS